MGSGKKEPKEDPKIVAKRKEIEQEVNKCDPEHLDITVYNDRLC